MLSHDNYCWIGDCIRTYIECTSLDRVVSFLPLSHVAAQLLDLFAAVTCGYTLYFAPPDAIRGNLINTLQEVRPTLFFGVPRVWEKMEQKMKDAGSSIKGVRGSLKEWCKKSMFDNAFGQLVLGKNYTYKAVIADYFLSKARSMLGLSECRLFVSGAAPIERATQEYFLSVGMPVIDLFGMSESSGPVSFSLPSYGAFKIGSVGRPIPGTDFVILNPDQNGHGEICWRGRNVFMGYHKDPLSTRETIDEFGFLHSGDIGYIENNFIFVTGRSKEIIITTGGENVAPTMIEEVVKSCGTFISNAMVVGDARKFLTLLISFKTEEDAEGNPTNVLLSSVRDHFRDRGSAASTVEEAMGCVVVRNLIKDVVHCTNKRAPSRAQHVQRWLVLPREFSQSGGEFTPTMKVKRRVVIDTYKPLIDEMYSHANYPNSTSIGSGGGSGGGGSDSNNAKL
eukprot:GHVR01179547.1.p1 GENE.GHVR01179547.1~~GHVR01179547.1.p1  ORF type:complete len:451 (+),score=114.06 GHVR01179547.1:104-1456(+)